MKYVIFLFPKQKEVTKSRANLAEDDGLDWLKPRALLKPDDQEEVADAVSTQAV